MFSPQSSLLKFNKKILKMEIKSGIINFSSRNMNCEAALEVYRGKSTYFCQQEEAVKVNRGSDFSHCIVAYVAEKGKNRSSMYGNLLIFRRTTHLIKDKLNHDIPLCRIE